MNLNLIKKMFHSKFITDLVALNLEEILSYHIYEAILMLKDL